MTPKTKNFVINILRKGSYRWPPRNEALRKARVSRGKYCCNICKGSFSIKEINRDHVVPCVPLSGWDSFDGYISRLFCNEAGFQVLCEKCHDEKTKQEDHARDLLQKVIKE